MYNLYKAYVHSVQSLCTKFACVPRERRSDAVNTGTEEKRHELSNLK